jgi:hypothetical protein
MPLPAPSDLVLKPLHVALFLAFAQDLENQVDYGPFEIIYGPISYFLFLFQHCRFCWVCYWGAPPLFQFFDSLYPFLICLEKKKKAFTQNNGFYIFQQLITDITII